MLSELKDQLSVDSNLVHLNNAGVSPMLRAATEAIGSATDLHSRKGFHAIDELIQRYEQAREVHGRLIGASAENVAFFQTCAVAISQVAFGLEFKPGDEIITWAQEYSSNAYPWHFAAKQSGATITVLPVEEDLSVDTDKLIAAINESTRVVTVSWVQFQTGAMTDLKRVSAACKKYDCWLVVDAIQGLGVIPFDMEEFGVDAVCGGTHKWLLGPLGHGFLGLASKHRESLKPLALGAVSYGFPGDPTDTCLPVRSDIHRYEPGTPLLMGALGAAASMSVLLNVGIERVNKAALESASYLRQELLARGNKILSPLGERALSPITTFVPKNQAEECSRRLDEKRISHSLRGGGIRLAPHGFSSERDIELVLEALSNAEG